MADFGSAKTGSFFLSEASIYLGPQADLYKLNPATHLLGLVKNFSLSYDVGYVELTQGVQNQIVSSTMNKSQLKASWEVFEYTAKNIAFGLGMNGAALTSSPVVTTTSGAVTGTYASPDMTLAVVSATGLVANSWIIVQGATNEEIFVDKIASVATNTLTLTFGIPDNLQSGATVRLATNLDLASTAAQPYLSAAAVSTLSDGTLIRVNLPKVRITKGFTLKADTKAYANLPFEATIYNLVTTDPNYSNFVTRQAELVMG